MCVCTRKEGYIIVWVCAAVCSLLCMCAWSVCLFHICMRRAYSEVKEDGRRPRPHHSKQPHYILFTNVSNAEIDLVGWIRISIFILESVAFDSLMWIDRIELSAVQWIWSAIVFFSPSKVLVRSSIFSRLLIRFEIGGIFSANNIPKIGCLCVWERKWTI